MSANQPTVKSFGSQPAWPVRLVQRMIAAMGLIPDSLIAALGRFSVAAVFWKSG